MKKAIIMKCNQKQWDSIKEKLVGCRINVYGDFKFFDYLVNDSGGEFNVVGNYNSYSKNEYNREVHETWNEQIFLEACGIETEKILKGSEMQYWSNRENKWNSVASGSTKYRLKPDHSKEIAELERQIEILKNK